MTSESNDIEPIFPQDLARRFETGEPLLLLDVREEPERAYCAIKAPEFIKDVHVPIGEVASHWQDIQSLASGLPIVVYCHHGVRSMAVATWLGRQGLSPIANLEGGIDAWSTQVDPTVARY